MGGAGSKKKRGEESGFFCVGAGGEGEFWRVRLQSMAVDCNRVQSLVNYRKITAIDGMKSGWEGGGEEVSGGGMRFGIESVMGEG